MACLTIRCRSKKGRAASTPVHGYSMSLSKEHKRRLREKIWKGAPAISGPIQSSSPSLARNSSGFRPFRWGSATCHFQTFSYDATLDKGCPRKADQRPRPPLGFRTWPCHQAAPCLNLFQNKLPSKALERSSKHILPAEGCYEQTDKLGNSRVHVLKRGRLL